MTFSPTAQMSNSPLAAHVNSAQPLGLYLAAISCKHTILKVDCFRLCEKAAISISWRQSEEVIAVSRPESPPRQECV